MQPHRPERRSSYGQPRPAFSIVVALLPVAWLGAVGPAPNRASVNVWATGDGVRVNPETALTTIELVVNGAVAKAFDVSDPHAVRGEAALTIAEGSWIAARCTARDDLLNDEELAVYTQGSEDSGFPVRPSRLRFGHTSPIYVTVAGRYAAVRASIEEGIRMLDAFERFARKTAGPDHRASILEAITEARARLEARRTR